MAYDADGQLQKIAISGGAAVGLGLSVALNGVSGGVDDMILFGQENDIFRVSANGGTPELIIEAEEGERLDGPQFLKGRLDMIHFRHRNWLG